MPGERLLRAARGICAVAIAAGAVQGLLAGAAVRAQAPAPDCPPGWVCPQGPQQEQEAPPGMSEQEAQMRLQLMQRSMGFGGIFGPALQNWLNSPSAPPAEDDACSGYTDYAAHQACGNGDLWAADRLQQDQSTPAERDWYNR